MKCTYELKMKARCPSNPQITDEYDVVVDVDRMIVVEELLATLGHYLEEAIYQEDITARLARKFNCKFTLTGYHSGIKTTCIAP